MTTYTPEETRRHRELWVEALESGEYPQGARRLNRGGEFCCLGVGCDVAIKNGVQVRVGAESSTGATVYDNATCLLPSSVRDWLGLADHRGSLKHPWRHEEWPCLWRCNDILGESFEQIAARIRAGEVVLADGHDIPPAEETANV